MSWALEEWKEGLPTRALQKIQELEGQLDKLKKEKQQRQFQLDTLEAALQKQKQKVENEKSEGTNLKRENQRLMEICENLDKTKQKISHELQVKESQVNFQEGQLNSAKKQIEKLEQEIKRCKSELERTQQAAQSADVSLNPCNTPQKIYTTSLTPSHCYSGSKYEDLKEKYNKEVEERKRLEAEVKALQAKKMSQTLPQTTMNHRDIARHQASSSVFSWQKERTPSHLSSNSQKTPVRRDFSTSYFSGEQEMTPSQSALQIGKRDTNSSFCDNSTSSHLLDQLKAQNQDLRSKINELELCLQGQEKEMKGQVNKFQETQLQLEKAKVELIDKEKILNKSRDELVRTAAQYDQASTKCTALEQKLKKLTEDLNCQRQNSESARCSLEQKIKEKEKEFQEELCRQQRSFQTLDQECTQMKARLTQELQQAKNTHNILQADLDKVTLVKQHLENNLEEFKQKFCRAEQAFQASQNKENELKRSVEEIKKENNLLKSQSEQKAREVCHLEEELKKVKHCLNQSENFAEEMKAKNTSQEAVLKGLEEKINQQENSLMLDKLKLVVADLEKQRDCSQDLLKKREHHIEQLNDKLSKTEKESKALLSALELKKKEYEELKEEKTLFSCWKSENENLLSQMESEKESLQSKINHLESCLKMQQIKSHEYNERVRTLEIERENLNVEIRNLHNIIDSKSVEIETQKQAYVALQQEAEFSDQKHKKEIENMCLKTSQLTGQVEALEHKLQLLSTEKIDKDQCYQDLHAEYESLRALLKSKESSLVTNENHQKSLLPFEQQPDVNNSFLNIIREQENVPSERSKCYLEADQSSKNSTILQNRIDSLEFSLQSQKQLNSDLQKQCEELVQIRREIEENLIKAEQMHQSFVTETSQRITKLQEDTSTHQNVVAETLVSLENKEEELQLLKEKLETEQAEIQELKKSNHLLKDSLMELQVLCETLSSEKKEMGAVISLNKRQIEELTQENETLKDINTTLNQEKMNLTQKSESFSHCVDGKEKSISELSDQYKQDRLTLLQKYEEARYAFEDLSEKYKAAQEKNSTLEGLLNECTSVSENRKNELEQLKQTFAKEHQDLLTKLAFTEERNQTLILQLGTVQQDLRSEIPDTQNNSKSKVDVLKQDIMTLKEEQNKMEVNDLLQENEPLMKLMKTKHECQNLELEPIRDYGKERESEINKCNFQLQMNSYSAQLVQLEAMIRNMELKLQESEKEKEYLQHELQTVRAELETRSLQGILSQEISGLKDYDMDAEEKYISVLHELSTSQNDNAHLQCSLQTAKNKLNELEKICEILKADKCELMSELNDSRSECITATSRMAEEVEKLVNEVKILNHENGLLHGDLVKEMPEGDFTEKQNEQQSVSLNPLDDSNSYEHLTLSHKEVQRHFAELQEKFSSLQSEHKILHDQHCQVSSKMSELQTYVNSLKAENLLLSANLRNFQSDLMKETKLDSEEGQVPSPSFSCVPDSPSLTSFGESSFYKALLEQTEETSLLNSLEGDVSKDEFYVDEMSNSSLEEESLTTKEIPSSSVRSVEELETLCQMYLQSLKNLEEKIESQGIMKNKEIQELEQLLSTERQALDCLRKQYLSENEQWQQKLTSVTMEMESKLAAEKKQTEQLSLELEVARLQLQGLDLSSRSLLGTDIEDAIQNQNESCDVKESEGYTPETIGQTPKNDSHQICDKDVQQELGLETREIRETDAVRLTEECSREQSPEVGQEMSGEEKTPGSSECISELSFSDPNSLGPMDFLVNQVTIQNLQLQVKKTSDENLRLLCVIKDRDKKVENLLNEIKELDSKLVLQQVQMKTKIEACVELEKIVEELKKANSDLSEKLESFSCDNLEVYQRIETCEVLNSNLGMGTDNLSFEHIEAKVNDNWKERFLGVENELNRIKSEKASMEHHVLSVKADLEIVQTEKLNLEKDNENKQKVIVSLEEELSVVTSERNRLHGELDIVSKENKELDRLSEMMKEKTQELEAHQGDCLHQMQVVEAEVKNKTEQLQTLSSDVSQLLKDKAHLQEQVHSLEKDSQALSLVKCELEIQMRLLNKEKELLLKESESLQAKLSESEHEKLNVCKALEAALVEKGEFAERLSSTQEEVHQLRRGIEKLRVRIEADEKKQLHVAEKLKENELENDLLKDKVESLERELQMSEENQELVIVDAENLKAEIETLKSQVEEMAESLKVLELDLDMVRSEKENLTKELQEKQNQVLELDKLHSSYQSLLEKKEQVTIQIKEASKTVAEMLQNQLKELNEEVIALCNDQETWKSREQSLDSSVEEVQQLRSSIEKLKVCIEADGKKQLHVLEQLKESKHHADFLKGRAENLERELEIVGKNQEHVILEAENAKAEVETLKGKIEGMASNLRDLELDLVNIKSEKENLTKELQKEQERVSELEILNSSFENLLLEKEQELVHIKEETDTAIDMLHLQSNELNEKLANLCSDLECYKTKEEKLSRQIDCLKLEKGQLALELDETRSNYITLQSSVNGLIQEVEDGKYLQEKKDEEISRLKSQIQDQEQLASRLFQVEGEQQLWKKEKVELGTLTVELEQKIQVLQSKNDTLQGTFETLQNSYKDMENELELAKMEKMSFVEKVNTMIAKETELQREVHEMMQKTTEQKEDFGREKNRLTEELNLLSEEIKNSKGQLKELVLENSELKKSLDCIHKDQVEKDGKMREEIAEYQLQLQEAEKKHQALLSDTNKQHEIEIQTYQEKLMSKEEYLNSQKLEMDLLKSSKEELNNSLKATTQTLEELKKTKTDNLKYVNKLKKENEHAQGKIKLLIKSCKQLEEEKEMLQKKLSQLEAAQEKQKTDTVVDGKRDELISEMKELKETLEEKTREADEYLDKYCSLLISHEKLEKANEMLETQVARLCSQQSKLDLQRSPLLSPLASAPSPVPSLAEKKLSSGQNKASGKRQRSGGIWENSGGSAPPTPEVFSKRSRKAVKSGIQPAEDTEDIEFEPEGLPEVVKKGFADIPTGKTSPYILRRTTMATRTSPRLAAQKLALSPLSLGKENLAESSKPTAGGSRSQKVKIAQHSPVDSGTAFQEPTTKTLSVNNLPERRSADSPRESVRPKRGRLAPSLEAGAEPSKDGENCKVQ
ncbi:centromere protein F [Otolemur garnettii]|uniref:Centromere protein F n=1 Tax=Otolemur garnettii TaxID=30611 RepID=H0WHX6_OTOGA|nr:centromere protein F [Otolemur garnettii]